MEQLRSSCRSFDEHKANYPKHAYVYATEAGDTLTYRVSIMEELQCEYVFSNDVCVELRVQFSCYPCLNKEIRKWVFKGRWRVDGTKTMYRFKDPARATIRRVEDCPFLFEVHLSSMRTPVPREAFKKMRRVENKFIGRSDRLLKEDQ